MGETGPAETAKTSERVRAIIDRTFEDQLRDTQGTIRIRSVLDEERVSDAHPFGSTQSEALEDFLARARRLGFRTKNLDNYAGYAELGEGELVGILVHLDVVPEGSLQDWQRPPYAADIANGLLHGRGSIDDKGPAVAALYAISALREAGVPLRKRFRLILGLDEESGSRCIMHYREVEEIPSFSFSPDAEFPVVNAEKGILRLVVSLTEETGDIDEAPTLVSLGGGDRFNVVPDSASAVVLCAEADRARIRTACKGFDVADKAGEGNALLISARGISAHAMEPRKGENAVQKLLAALNSIDLGGADAPLVGNMCRLVGSGHAGEGMGIACRDDISGELTCNLATVSLSVGEGRKTLAAKLDIRYPVTADGDGVLNRIKQAVADCGGSCDLKTHKKPLYVPEDHAAVQALLDAYQAVMGYRARPVSMGGGTYCRFMPNAVSAGPLFPGQPELAHQPNEQVALEDLRKSTYIYAEALLRFNELDIH